jgi:hypothetical protein
MGREDRQGAVERTAAHLPAAWQLRGYHMELRLGTAVRPLQIEPDLNRTGEIQNWARQDSNLGR